MTKKRMTKKVAKKTKKPSLKIKKKNVKKIKISINGSIKKRTKTKRASKKIKKIVKKHAIKKIKNFVKQTKITSREIVLKKPMTKALVIYKPAHKKMLTGIRSVENTTRDFINWLAVFKTEYGIPPEAYETLHEKMDEFSTRVGAITCDVVGTIDTSKIKLSANTLRDTKAWLAVFAREYDLASEAACVLREKLDEIGEKLANVECK